jgi:acetolactate synthase-1/2/3 large subunit
MSDAELMTEAHSRQIAWRPEAYGAKGTRVNAGNELRSTPENAFASGGVYLIVVPIDYSENKRVLVDELRQRLPAA